MMEEEFYASIKLKSGEEVFSLVCVSHENDDMFLILDNPVVFEIIEIKKTNAMAYKVRPWINISDDEMFIIKFSDVMTMTEVKSSRVIGVYKKFLNQSEDIEKSLDRTMGFISKVDKARDFLENIYRTK
jgi:hypothetical protein